MSDAERPAPGENAGGDEIVSRYAVVPYAEKTDDADLYSFRASLPAPAPAAPPPTPAQQAVATRKRIFLVAGVAGLGILFVALIVLVVSNKQDPAVPFIDLGPNNVASAGLAGRLIVKWDGKSEYELHVDPLVPRQIPGFAAVAGNPPRPISFDLRMKDASGNISCQKEIVLGIDTGAQANPEQAEPQVPTQTIGGDVVQNVAGTDGQVDEIVINGQIPCPLKSYKTLASWDFASSFPTVAEQDDWMHHEQGVAAELRRKAAEARAKAFIPRVRPLPAPIDGDDVIVFDNPLKGMVETKSGRLFFVGKDGLRGRAPGWQVFPANIHFHCDLKANCVLTRADATTSLQARLVH
jgi:hypothetical protein